MTHPPSPDYRYDAFISYRHVEPDRRYAKWLHSALETYRLPARLAARLGVRPRLDRVFRDEDELPANADLKQEIDVALQQSRFLIVVCSPRTPGSLWINKEVLRFRELGRHDQILALLIEGEPAESFPPALCEIRRTFLDAAGGTLEQVEAVEPLAADVRPTRQESPRHLKRLAKLRLLACILGCRFDDLRQREHERQVARWTAAGAGLLLLLLLISALAVFALIQRNQAIQQQREAQQQKREAQRQKNVAEEARKKAETERDRAQRLFSAGQKLGHDFIFDFYRTIEDLPGSTPAKRQLVSMSLQYLQTLQRDAANDPSLLRDIAMAYAKVGDIQELQGNLKGALANQQEALEIRERLVADDPVSAQARFELSISYVNLGIVHRYQGDLKGALANHQKALAIREKLVADDPVNVQSRRTLAYSYYNIGDVYLNQGDLKNARANYENALAIREKLLADNPNHQAYSDLTHNYGRIADVQSRQGDLKGALESAQKALVMAERMAAVNPAGIGTRRALSIGFHRIGGTYAKLGDQKGALAYYQKALVIYEKLTVDDPSYAQARRDMSSCCNAIGNTLAAQGDLEGAWTSHQKALAMREKLATDNPTNVEARSDLSGSYYNIGDIQKKRGDQKGALESYQKALTIAIGEKPGADNPNDTLASGGTNSPCLFTWLLHTRLGETEAANKELADFLGKRANPAPGDWVSQVGGFLLGTVTEAELFAASASPDVAKERGQRCEAWYYAGMKKLFSGDKNGATESFRNCLATEQKDFLEYQFAQSELKARGE